MLRTTFADKIRMNNGVLLKSDQVYDRIKTNGVLEYCIEQVEKEQGLFRTKYKDVYRYLYRAAYMGTVHDGFTVYNTYGVANTSRTTQEEQVKSSFDSYSEEEAVTELSQLLSKS